MSQKQFMLKNKQVVQAVDDVSLKVSEGGSIAIIGPSGCGKTTLLRMIAGLESPDSGRVLYNDEPLAEMSKKDRGIGMVFQDYALIPQWDSEGNIGFFLRLRGRQREVPERVRQISKITGVGIEDLMKKFPKHLSGGEKQRVAIARAFARDLKLLLFDEPFANLDAKLRQQARFEARRLLTQYPVTTIYVTHDQQEASMMSDRVVLMENGKIIQVGSYSSLYNSPVNIFVAGFIGVPTMNLFKGTIREGRWYGADFGNFTIPMDDINHVEITCGIRPEHIRLDGEIEVRIIKSTPYYAEGFLLLDVSSGQEIWEIQVPLDSKLSPGDKLTIGFPHKHIHYFDTLTGERLS